MKFIDKFFTNRYTFSITALLSVIGLLVNSAVLMNYSHNYNIFAEYATLILALSIVALVISTAKHLENTAKGIVGTMLGITFLYDLYFFSKNCHNNPVKNNVLFIVKLSVDIILIVSYMISRENHAGGSKFIRACQASSVVLIAITVINNIPYFISDFPDPDHRWIIQDIGETVGFAMMYLSIVCVACIVDKYKIIRKESREKGDWTEEKRQETKKELFGK